LLSFTPFSLVSCPFNPDSTHRTELPHFLLPLSSFQPNQAPPFEKLDFKRWGTASVWQCNTRPSKRQLNTLSSVASEQTHNHPAIHTPAQGWHATFELEPLVSPLAAPLSLFVFFDPPIQPLARRRCERRHRRQHTPQRQSVALHTLVVVGFVETSSPLPGLPLLLHTPPCFSLIPHGTSARRYFGNREAQHTK
jgi:hypothetical protein